MLSQILQRSMYLTSLMKTSLRKTLHLTPAEEELKNNPELKLELYVDEWVTSLDRDDNISLGLFLTYNLENALQYPSTKAAECAAIMLGKSERTVWQWRTDFLENGEILHNKQGRYQRTGLLWSNEELNKKASCFIRENCNVKGHGTKPYFTQFLFLGQRTSPPKLLFGTGFS